MTEAITVTPVKVADLLAEGERMPVYVHVIDHPDGRVLERHGRWLGVRGRPPRVSRFSRAGSHRDTRPKDLPARRGDWHSPPMDSVLDAAGGKDGLLRLAGAWHARVLADEVVGHAFRHGTQPDHIQRLAAYWAEALGGPDVYTSTYGDESSVVRIHSGNGEHDEMDRRAIACFDRALEDTGLATDETLRATLHDYFAWATTTTMAAYPRSPDDVPAGLRVPRWSWDGPQPDG